jgi:hypothetical protein
MISESLSIKEGLAGRVGEKPKIPCKSRFIEHLREKEGLDETPALSGFKLAGNRLIRGRAIAARRALGTGFGEQRAAQRFASGLEQRQRQPFM